MSAPVHPPTYACMHTAVQASRGFEKLLSVPVCYYPSSVAIATTPDPSKVRTPGENVRFATPKQVVQSILLWGIHAVG